MKKDLEELKNLKDPTDFNVIIERDSEGYFVGSVIELPGCHTQAKTRETLMERLREAIELYLEVQGKREEYPEFLGIDKVSI